MTTSKPRRSFAIMRLPAAALAVVLVACQDSTPPVPTMTGQWRQSGDLVDLATGDSHIHAGTFALQEHPDGSFDGTGSQQGLCSSDGTTYRGPLTDEAPFAVLDGRVAGDSVEFRTALCHFRGHFTDRDRWRMVGTASCSFTWSGQEYQFQGQWQADR